LKVHISFFYIILLPRDGEIKFIKVSK